MASAAVTASVIIPAHNEERGLARCLEAITDTNIKLDVIVVANACTDSTAAVARRHGARVVETHVAGKANALNLGDAATSVFPRVYLDADTTLTATDVAVLTTRLRDDPTLLAVSPSLDWSVEPLGWLCRRYYAHWKTTQYVSTDLLGSGCYVLSERGRATFAEFPDIISDDGFLHRTIPPGQRDVETVARLTIFPPRTLRHLLATKIRAKVGDIQLRTYLARGHDVMPADSDGHDDEAHGSYRLYRGDGAPSIGPTRSMLERVVDRTVYLSIRAIVALAAHRRVRRGDYSWSRDDTSREVC